MVRVAIKMLNGKIILTNNLRLFKSFTFIDQNANMLMTFFDFTSAEYPKEKINFKLIKASPLGVVYEQFNA